MKRYLAAVPGVILAGLLSSCGAGVASGSGAGVAARVGDEVISVQDLREVVERAKDNAAIAAQASSDPTGFQRGVLTRLVLGELYDVAAGELDITITDEQVTQNIAAIEERLGGREQLLQAAASMGLVEADIAPFVRSGMINDEVATAVIEKEPVTEEQVRAAYEANRERFDVAEVQHILVASEATARGIIARLRAGEDFATLARTFSTDPGSKERGGNLGSNPRGTFFRPFEEAVFSARVGQVVGPVQTEAGWHVIKVLKRQVRSLAEARDELVTEIRGGGRDEARVTYLGELSRRLRIRVNPRFGRWDSETASILPADDQLSSPEPRPGAVEPGSGLVPPPGDPQQPGQPQPGQPQPGQPQPGQPQPGQPAPPAGAPGAPAAPSPQG
ncbi:MAG TPA: peptidylprolyl isomerase [Mycobacteriales bacterium]|nr:peptidylprolyl isomerase [Mycobacteriales bacterium]